MGLQNAYINQIQCLSCTVLGDCLSKQVVLHREYGLIHMPSTTVSIVLRLLSFFLGGAVECLLRTAGNHPYEKIIIAGKKYQTS